MLPLQRTKPLTRAVPICEHCLPQLQQVRSYTNMQEPEAAWTCAFQEESLWSEERHDKIKAECSVDAGETARETYQLFTLKGRVNTPAFCADL